MKTISLRIEEEAKERWDTLARRHSLNVSQLMREAIRDRLEELEDFYVVRERERAPGGPIANEEVWKRFADQD